MMGESSESESVAWLPGIWILPTEETKATISMLCASLRYFSAMAPAATLPITKLV